MIPVTWPEVANVHPFTPVEQTAGYLKMIDTLVSTHTPHTDAVTVTVASHHITVSTHTPHTDAVTVTVTSAHDSTWSALTHHTLML